MDNSMRGHFITFEGIDGAGKSTHIPFVTDLLKQAGKTVVVSREPGGTKLGEALRSLLLHEKMNLETEALLSFASRREHVDQVIEPALARGNWVISDRFSDSSFAYQGGGRGLSFEKLHILENWVHPHLQPDLTLLFDIDLDVARSRLDTTRVLDKFEMEKRDFFENTRNAYFMRVDASPERFRVIDSSQPIITIQQQLATMISTYLDNVATMSSTGPVRSYRI